MKDTVVCIGDSLTFGYPFDPDESWVSRGAIDVPDAPVLINRGVNGDTSLKILRRFRRDVLRFDPAAVILTVGTNDACMEIDEDVFMDRIAQCCEIAMEAGIECVIGLPIPALDGLIEDNLSVLRQALKHYCEAQGLKMIDFYTPFMTHGTDRMYELFVDGVHPSDLGYQIMSDTFSAFLKLYVK